MNPVDYQQLREQYRQMSDEEILRLASSSEELTDQAKNAVGEETNLRGLGEAQLLPYRAKHQQHLEKIEAEAASGQRGFNRAKKFVVIVSAAWVVAFLANALLRRSGADRDLWYPVQIITYLLTVPVGYSLMWLVRTKVRLWRTQDHLDQFR